MKLINHIIKRILLPAGFFFIFVLSGNLNAQKYFSITPGIKYAYRTITYLQLDKAQQILDSLKIAEPGNMLIYHIENYIDFYRIFINEDEDEFEKLRNNKDYRIEKIESGDKDSPYYQFSKAEITLQWAIVRLKFGENAKAAFEVRSAFKALKKNQKKFPGFVANYKSLSVIHALTGTLTGLNKTIFTTITGIDGTIKQGASEIKKLIEYTKNNYFLFKDESYTIASFIAFHLENDKEKAWKLINEANLDIKNSPLACFVLANMAQKTGKNEFAIKILENKPNNPGQLSFYYLDYMLGKSLLYKSDRMAYYYLKRFVDNFNGINYIKDAYLKLAWFELIVNNDEKAYWQNIAKCISEGASIVDEDKTAKKVAFKSVLPNPVLLKARLLYDGSYYDDAYSVLIKNKKLCLNSYTNRLEFNYRMGRVLQALNNYDEAIKYFENAVKTGEGTNSHFVCNSLLQMGVIYEKLSKYKQAKKYYKNCLDIDSDEYKNSIHQKAKAGLIRIKH